MSTKIKMLWLFSLLPFFIACGDDNTDIPDWPWAEPETPTEPVEANPDIVNQGWTNVKDVYGTLPVNDPSDVTSYIYRHGVPPHCGK